MTTSAFHELRLTHEPMPPAGSAAHADDLPYRKHRRPDDVEAPVRGGLKAFLVVLVLSPLLVLLANRVPDWFDAPILATYGIAVLGSTLFMFYIAYARYEDPSDPMHARRIPNRIDAPRLPRNPRVTMLLAVMNEIDVIDRCVRSIASSSYQNTQIIIVDDCSTDGTRERLQELQRFVDFELVCLERNAGKKHALVAGARQATGDVIAFTDSDCVLAPNAIERCVQALVLNPSLGAVSGHCRALNADASLLTRIQDTWYQGSFRVTKGTESNFGTVTCVSGPLAVFRREAIWNYLPAWAGDTFLGAPFKFATDRQLTGYVLGQRWIGADLKDQYATDDFVTAADYPEREWRVGYVESAWVWTVVPETLRTFLKQQIRWKKSFFRNLFFTGTFMWRRGVMPAALYYGHALWVLAAPIMAVRHLVWAPLAGLWFLTLLYVLGVLIKGVFWGMAFSYDQPGTTRWRYRPAMSLVSSVILSWFLPYSLATIRKGTWSRGAA